MERKKEWHSKLICLFENNLYWSAYKIEKKFAITSHKKWWKMWHENSLNNGMEKNQIKK
jgi:hypothetical protein